MRKLWVTRVWWGVTVPRGVKAPLQYFMRVEDADKLSGPYETKAAARLRKSLQATQRKSEKHVLT